MYFLRFCVIIYDILLASTEGAPLEILRNLRHLNTNGLIALKTLIRTFGRHKHHTVLLTSSFKWIPKLALHRNWGLYKLLIDGEDWIIDHPGYDKLAIEFAMLGLSNFPQGIRTKEYLRTGEVDMDSWEKFRDAVDLFLGDVYRDQYKIESFRNPKIDKGLNLRNGLPINSILSSETGLSPIPELKSEIPILDKNKPDDLRIKKQTLKNSPTQKVRNKVAATKKKNSK